MFLRITIGVLVASAMFLGEPATVRGTASTELAKQSDRFVVTAKPRTVRIGEPCQIDLEIHSAAGAKRTAAADTLVTLTVTTLPTLDAAKKAAAAAGQVPSKPRSLEKQRIELPAGVPVQRLVGIFPKGDGDVEFEVVFKGAGRVRVFAEANGIETGSTLIAVTSKPYQFSKARLPLRGDIQLVSMMEQPGPDIILVIEDSGNNVIRRAGLLTQTFFVSLQTSDGQDAVMSTDLAVNLHVHSGRARFDPRTLIIPATQVVSREGTDLKSSLGGQVEIVARSLVQNIKEARLKYAFEPGLRTTELLVKPSVPSALANGLDRIEVQVQAVYRRGADTIVMPAEQEELEHREVEFFLKGRAQFVGGSNKLIIPKNASSGTIAIVAASPSSRLEIDAVSTNGLGEPVAGTATVTFHLPWGQLLCAALGGLLIPAITRKALTTIALGSVGGAIVYLLVFFGAVVTGVFNFGQWAVAITKLPSENVLAACVLGIIGYVTTQKAFDITKASAAEKPRVKPRATGSRS